MLLYCYKREKAIPVEWQAYQEVLGWLNPTANPAR
jgi:hypothetical protein